MPSDGCKNNSNNYPLLGTYCVLALFWVHCTPNFSYMSLPGSSPGGSREFKGGDSVGIFGNNLLNYR